MLIIGRIAVAWLLFVGLAYADGTFGVGADGLTFAVGNGIGKKGSGGGTGPTSYSWSGPSTGTAGLPSSNFTVTATGGTTKFNGTETITISDGSKGGTITPSVGSPGTSSVTVTPTNGSSSFTFTYTAVLGDAITLTGTNGQSWSNPSPLTYTGAVTYTMTGPSSGTAGSPSTNFTVSMPAGTQFSGTDTVTIADGSQGGTFTPSVGSPGTSTVTVTPAAAATSFTYTYNAAVITAVTLTATNGQSWTNPSPLTYTGSAPSYTGPVDAAGSSARAWWGLRASTSADRGNKLINLCEPTNTTCVDVASSAVTGKLVAPTNVGGTDCTAVNTCTIKTWYDRGGQTACGSAACDITQATAGNRLTLTYSCINGLPCAVMTASTAILTNSTGFTLAQPYTHVTFANRSSGTGGGETVNAGSTVMFFGFRNTTANTVQVLSSTAGQTVGNITDANWHSFQILYSGGSSTLVCGGSAGTNCSGAGKSNSVSPGAVSMSGALSIEIPGTSSTTIEVAESGIFNGSVSSVTANIAAYYGSF